MSETTRRARTDQLEEGERFYSAVIALRRRGCVVTRASKHFGRVDGCVMSRAEIVRLAEGWRA